MSYCPRSGKVMHASQHQANAARAAQSRSSVKQGSVYRCNHCGGWHVSKLSRGDVVNPRKWRILVFGSEA